MQLVPVPGLRAAWYSTASAVCTGTHALTKPSSEAITRSPAVSAQTVACTIGAIYAQFAKSIGS